MKSCCCLIVLGLLLRPPVYADPPDPGTLAAAPGWLKLGHYQPDTLGSGWTSQIDSGRFFLAPDGRRSPQHELEATYRALAAEQQSAEHEISCRYPARLRWLNRRLRAGWTMPDCEALMHWRQVIDPAAVTLVFPTAFMNNPSSMFGHTLLRVDARDQTRHKELVAFAVNYAAAPDENDNAALYALKGLTGAYPGAFSLMPYYRKVREYNDLESRDIWEYPLNFSQTEVETILFHVWELQDARFDYYFFDENCSYQLLSLLQVARDDLELTAAFPLHAIPSDTVKVLAQNGLLRVPAFRPAFGTRLSHDASQLDDAQFAGTLARLNGEPGGTLTPEQAAAQLEFAYEWLNFRFYDERLDRDQVAPRLTSLLLARSQLDVPSPYTPVPVPEDSPVSGHGSMRAGLGLWGGEAKSLRLTLHWRAAYHDLFDRQGGFVPGAQISFLDLVVSAGQNGGAAIERLYLLDAMSLAPDNRVFDSWSWNIRAGSDRQPLPGGWKNRGFVQGGYGKSWGQPDRLHLYLLASTEANAGAAVAGTASAGLGAEAGMIITLDNQDKLALTGQWLALAGDAPHQRSQASLLWNAVLSRDLAIRSELGYRKWQSDDAYAALTGYWYF